ncbi:MAG: GNAT family N-acetyltransferase [Segetibacter sp.]
MVTLTQISQTTFYDTFHEENTKENIELFIENCLGTEVLENEFSDPHNHFFFAKIGAEVAGYIKLSTAASKELTGEVLEISRIYVTKEMQERGVGKALMKFATSFAVANVKKVIFLGVWERNKKAIRFYEKFGFKKFGEHLFLVGKDAQTDWLMKKDIG